ncbi:hypothetical protein D8674_000759 [Pyrus ussuriensis x Pyrus communis]|uniref:Uncharacterized protein n=1 Tax=Pyrus ussuriensis x Pyrus communis TaxID=2448454 RepID=A0A5N5F443_9ROSA|nr:hypothetical protein D8674_000759 [Pyrus ussuriensis x Pyrus communis]
MACNNLSFLTFVLHILGDGKDEEFPSPENLCQALKSLSNFERYASSDSEKPTNAEVLVRDLALGLTCLSKAPKHGKVHASNNALGGTGDCVYLQSHGVVIHMSPDMVRVRASVEFPWAESFNELGFKEKVEVESE